MRMSTTGGATPRDRRFDRRKVAIAASCAALFLIATSARANVVEFKVDQDLSSLNYGVKLVGPALGGAKSSVPQQTNVDAYGDNSDTTHYFGSMYVDIQDTTIQLLPGAYISAVATGSYVPFDPVDHDPSSATPGVTPNANYGVAVAAIGLQAVLYNLRIDNGWAGNSSNPAGNPSTPMALSGGNFNLSGQAISTVAGRQAFISALGNDTNDVVGDPLIFFGSAASDIGTWDDTTNTLTIPVHSTYSFVVTNDFGGISEFVNVSGQLVLHAAPEPSTMVMAAFGIAGLLSYGWRASKRRMA
jgi:hypothetical protein